MLSKVITKISILRVGQVYEESSILQKITQIPDGIRYTISKAAKHSSINFIYNQVSKTKLEREAKLG